MDRPPGLRQHHRILHSERGRDHYPERDGQELPKQSMLTAAEAIMISEAPFTIDPDIASSIPEIGLRPTADEVSLFRRSGVGVVRGLLEADEVEKILDDYMTAVADGPVEGVSEARTPGSGKAPSDPLVRYPRMLHPHRSDLPFGRTTLRYMLDQRIWDVLRAIAGEDQLAAQSMFYFKPPGARGQGLHQDNRPLSVKPGTCIAAWIAMDRTDEANGALAVVPGSGPIDTLCDVEHEQRSDLFFNGGSLVLPEGISPVTAEMERGDALFFNGQTIHGSWPNQTADRWRRSLIFHYAPASCEEINAFYHPLLASDGSEVVRRASPAGGICGAINSGKSV